MPTRDLARVLRFVVAGPLVLAFLCTLILSPIANAADAGAITLASASDGRTLKVSGFCVRIFQ